MWLSLTNTYIQLLFDSSLVCMKAVYQSISLLLLGTSLPCHANRASVCPRTIVFETKAQLPFGLGVETEKSIELPITH